MKYLIIIAILLSSCIAGNEIDNIEGQWINEKESITVKAFAIEYRYSDGAHTGELIIENQKFLYSYQNDTLFVFYDYEDVKYWRK